MRRLLISILTIASIVIFIRCEKSNEGTNEISQEDISSIEGMEKSYDLAKQYDDSLLVCLDSNQFCEDGFVEYCDSLFHNYDERYEYHHNNYSHQNGNDDHHHEYMGQNEHGNGMHDGGNNQGYMHDEESMNAMEELRELHDEHYH